MADLDSNPEIWKPVLGKEGRYEVSSLGRVRSLDRHTERRASRRHPLGRIEFIKGKMLTASSSAGGYRAVTLEGRDKRFVHRLVLEAFMGPCPDGQEARHLNDDRANNALTNLAWGTRSENVKDAIKNGRKKVGESAAGAVITRAQAEVAIKNFHLSPKEVERELGVKASVVRDIRAGRSWAWLWDEMRMPKSEILEFQAGREAAINGARRDGRRSTDWLRGWDQIEDEQRRSTDDK